jgi:N-acetylmuramate 1-kinase
MSPPTELPGERPATPALAVSHAPVSWPDPARQAAFDRWISSLAPAHTLHLQTLHLASADASFRRYLRVDSSAGSRIIMDAPPDKENSRPFVDVAALMAKAGLRVPEVLAWDEPGGFLLLSDLGTHTLMQTLNRADAQANQARYLDAVQALITWQLASLPGVLPPYDDALLRQELALFPDWYLSQHRQIAVQGELRQTLDTAFNHIVAQNLAWPSVYVHRDFMPRNLMPGGNPLQPLGVLDFQDAVYGPITYDIASLMRDAFLSWDEDFVLDITIRYWQQARAAGLPVGDDFGEFYRGVEWMGLQRHLTVAGIFARLTLRDGKPRYLADTPRFINYIRATCSRYRELKPLLRLIDQAEGIAPSNTLAYNKPQAK